MHGAGINHRDYYLCHFHLYPETLDSPGGPRCHLIELHRAQQRREAPRRWRVKDIAGLYFSAMDIGLQRRDLLRFVQVYSGRDASTELRSNHAFWSTVASKAEQLYLREHGRYPGFAWHPSRGNDVGDESVRATIREFERNTNMIKSGSVSRVGLVQVADGSLSYVKHYRARSLGQRLALALGVSRPQRCFSITREIKQQGLPVPDATHLLPVTRPGSLPWGCYFIGEGLLGSDLRALWVESEDRAGLTPLLAQTGLELARLHQADYVHGDCKWSNIHFQTGRLTWLDLDNAGRFQPKRAARDVARFVVNAEDLAAGREQLDEFLNAYAEARDMTTVDLLHWIGPALAKLRARHAASYGERGSRLV
jgi:tRNA A-37 threonylcarbamoyl transferase component Bud32